VPGERVPAGLPHELASFKIGSVFRHLNHVHLRREEQEPGAEGREPDEPDVVRAWRELPVLIRTCFFQPEPEPDG
jgi:hypothetical protein